MEVTSQYDLTGKNFYSCNSYKSVETKKKKTTTSKFGLVSLCNKVKSYYAAVKTGATKVYQTAFAAGRRAVLCGSAGAIFSGSAAALALGLGIANPFIGIPVATVVGTYAVGAGFLTGACIGATVPIAKRIVSRLTGQNLVGYQKRIAELEKQNAAYKEQTHKMLESEDVVVIDKNTKIGRKIKELLDAAK